MRDRHPRDGAFILHSLQLMIRMLLTVRLARGMMTTRQAQCEAQFGAWQVLALTHSTQGRGRGSSGAPTSRICGLEPCCRCRNP